MDSPTERTAAPLPRPSTERDAGVAAADPDGDPGIAAAPDAAAGPGGDPGGQAPDAGGGLSYHRLMRELAAARAERDRERDAAHAWYAGQCTAAEQAVHRHQLAVAEATEAVAAAEDAVAHTDDEASHLWKVLRRRLGPRASARMGSLPEPEVEPGAPIRHPHAHLDTVRRLVAAAGRGLNPRRYTYPLLVLCGLGGAVVGWLVGQGLLSVRAGGGSGTMVHTLGSVVLILAPAWGLIPAFLLLRRQGEKLTSNRAIVSVLTGLLLVCGLNYLI
jgi:hypothetical protein